MNPATLHRDESGTLTIWMLGLAVTVLFLGGLSLDLWRAFAERRALGGIVDSAAIAAASALDEEAFRRDGSVVLDPASAEAVACAYLVTHGPPDSSCAGIGATPQAIRVRATTTVPLSLVRVLSVGVDEVVVGVEAVAEPHRAP